MGLKYRWNNLLMVDCSIYITTVLGSNRLCVVIHFLGLKVVR